MIVPGERVILAETYDHYLFRRYVSACVCVRDIHQSAKTVLKMWQRGDFGKPSYKSTSLSFFILKEKTKSFKWRLSLKPQQYPFVQQIDVTIIVCFCYAMIIFVAHAKPREKTSGVDYWIDNNVWVNHRSVPNGPEQMFALLKKPWHCCARFPWNPIPVMCRRLFVMRKTVWFIYYFCLLSIICG